MRIPLSDRGDDDADDGRCIIVPCTIHVCQAGTCRSRGSDAALLEIEELAQLVINDGHCDADAIRVEPSGCMGYCRRGPAVAVERRGFHYSRRVENDVDYYTKVGSFQKSAMVVGKATGIVPDVLALPEHSKARLSQIRSSKRLEFLEERYLWNQALLCLREQAQLLTVSGDKSSIRTKLLPPLKRILKKVGLYDGDERALDFFLKGFIRSSDQELDTFSFGMDRFGNQMPTMEGYVPWTVDRVEVASAHSVVLHLTCDDMKRGTPHPRGRGRMAQPVTWHVTMLGEVGPNCEGLLPWIERDYTPVSSALDWERGRCVILVKVYNDGKLTSWLRRRTAEKLPGVVTDAAKSGDTSSPPPSTCQILLSKPMATLSMPRLVAPEEADGDNTFQPSSVLLLLAGTGIVALPQILAHREPTRLLGIPTPRSAQMQKCPIDVLHSCRRDDVLMRGEIRQWCLEWTNNKNPKRMKGIRNYQMLATEPGGEAKAPYDQEYHPDQPPPTSSLDVFGEDVPNAVVLPQRLNFDVVKVALTRMVHPNCRVVVSGPNGFNEAALTQVLATGLVERTQVTVLAA